MPGGIYRSYREISEKEGKSRMITDELALEVIGRLGDSDFDYEVDEVEWKDPKYWHQN